MNLREVQRNWDLFGQTDPYWAILTKPGTENNRWRPDEFFATGEAEIRCVMEYVAEIAPGLERSRALDFGCGVGRLTQPLAAHFDTVVGVDIAHSMIERARKLNAAGDRCQFILNDRNDLSVIESGSCNFIYSTITLQHMPPRYARGYLREFVRVLAPRGILLFQLPSRFIAPMSYVGRILVPAWRVYRNVFRPQGPVMDMFGTRPKRVRKVLEEEGLTILSVLPDESSGAWEGFRYCAQKA